MDIPLVPLKRRLRASPGLSGRIRKSPPVKDRCCHCICPSPLAVLNSSPSNEEKNERRVFISYVSSNKCNCYDVVLPRIGKKVKERAHELCLLCECKYETRNTIAIMTPFDFTNCFSSCGDKERQSEGEKLLRDASLSFCFNVKDMFTILCDKESCICRGCDDTFPTQGSQVSSLVDNTLSVHWFTATPDPSVSYFKPFIFTPKAQVSPFTESPNEPKREHYLYKLHAEHLKKENKDNITKILEEMEDDCLMEIEEYLANYKGDPNSLDDLDNLMKNGVEAEVKLYG